MEMLTMETFFIPYNEETGGVTLKCNSDSVTASVLIPFFLISQLCLLK